MYEHTLVARLCYACVPRRPRKVGGGGARVEQREVEQQRLRADKERLRAERPKEGAATAATLALTTATHAVANHAAAARAARATAATYAAAARAAASGRACELKARRDRRDVRHEAAHRRRGLVRPKHPHALRHVRDAGQRRRRLDQHLSRKEVAA